jgi:murein DD-endopeptidase MepM/ murein hydrolase activator NlpD
MRLGPVRVLVWVGLVLVAVTAWVVAGPGGRSAFGAGSGEPGYRLPVPGGVVVRPFEPPPGPYAPGHRGVDLAPAGPVLAAGAGTVTVAGSVAGRGVVVIAHPDGISTEYEPVTATVTVGERVAAGQLVGTVTGLHGTCLAACLHWGARRGGTYLDPMRLLRPLGVVRLLPDG